MDMLVDGQDVAAGSSFGLDCEIWLWSYHSNLYQMYIANPSPW